jgi:5-(carboxyamino)imidazole ribonucleotide mutase
MAPRVGVVMGSKSDAPTMQLTMDVLAEMGIEAEIVVVSAHRTPEKAREYGQTARARGIEVLIAGAGMAAALPGALASWTTLPVIGVPLAGSELKGLDALYAIVQMPAGVPVATVAIGSAGAKNAGYLAAQIIGLHDERVRAAYDAYRDKQARG